MEGRRFGVGLVAGILLGLAIITVGGGLSSVPGVALFSPSASSQATSSTSMATSAATVTMSSTTLLSATSSSSSATFGGATSPQQVHPSNESEVATGTTTARSSSTSIQTTAITTSDQGTLTNLGSNVTYAQNGANTPSYSSRIYNIAHQPALSDAVILLPVLVAFFAAVVLYKVSIRDKDEPT